MSIWELPRPVAGEAPTALVERVVHHADIVKIEGESYRLCESQVDATACGKSRDKQPKADALLLVKPETLLRWHCRDSSTAYDANASTTSLLEVSGTPVSPTSRHRPARARRRATRGRGNRTGHRHGVSERDPSLLSGGSTSNEPPSGARVTVWLGIEGCEVDPLLRTMEAGG